jgi:hypothetical protein
MKVVPLVLALFLCVCGCKKKAADSAASSGENPQSSSQTPDASQPDASQAAASAPAAPGTVAHAPNNPGVKVPPPGPPVHLNGVTINVQNAEKALATASWNANVAMGDLRYALRYENFQGALNSLQKAASDPSVNDAQRAVLQQVMQEVQQAAAAQPR